MQLYFKKKYVNIFIVEKVVDSKMKKLLGLLLVLVLVLAVRNVNAKNITINEVNGIYGNTIIYYSPENVTYSTAVDVTNKTLKVRSNNETLITFNFTNEYIEFNAGELNITQENVNDQIMKDVLVKQIFINILDISGYTTSTFNEAFENIWGTPTTNSDEFYEQYGLKADTVHYMFNNPGETLSGDAIKYLKISLNTAKIDDFAEEYMTHSNFLTITDVFEHFKEKFEGMSYYPSLDVINHAIRITSPGFDDGWDISCNYTDEYIEFVDNSEINVDSADENMVRTFFFNYLWDSVKALSGYEEWDLDIDDDFDYTNSFDTYGLYVVTEEIDSNIDSFSDEFVRHAKVSLDKTKMDALMEDYGELYTHTGDIGTPWTIDDEAIGATLNVGEVKEHSVVLYPGIIFPDEVPDGVIHYCKIYRSTSENGTYELISSREINCDGTVGLVDDNLAGGVSYWYKVSNERGNIMTEPVKVTTKSTNDKSVVDTGFFVPTITIVALAACGLGTYLSLKKKRAIAKI